MGSGLRICKIGKKRAQEKKETVKERQEVGQPKGEEKKKAKKECLDHPDGCEWEERERGS